MGERDLQPRQFSEPRLWRSHELHFSSKIHVRFPVVISSRAGVTFSRNNAFYNAKRFHNICKQYTSFYRMWLQSSLRFLNRTINPLGATALLTPLEVFRSECARRNICPQGKYQIRITAWILVPSFSLSSFCLGCFDPGRLNSSVPSPTDPPNPRRRV